MKEFYFIHLATTSLIAVHLVWMRQKIEIPAIQSNSQQICQIAIHEDLRYVHGFVSQWFFPFFYMQMDLNGFNTIFNRCRLWLPGLFLINVKK